MKPESDHFWGSILVLTLTYAQAHNVVKLYRRKSLVFQYE